MQDEVEPGCEHVLQAFDLSDGVVESTDAPDVIRLAREFSSAITAYHGVPASEVHRSAILFWWRVRSRLASRFGSIEAFRAHAMQDPGRCSVVDLGVGFAEELARRSGRPARRLTRSEIHAIIAELPGR